MSESIGIELFTVVMPMLFQLGRKMAQPGQSESSTAQRHLLRRSTQMNDGQLLRQTLEQLGVKYQAGDPSSSWSPPGNIELSILDEAGRPWLALARDAQSGMYDFYSQDTRFDQADLPHKERLSDKDPAPFLGQLAQHYGYFKTLQTLQREGYEIKGASEQAADGSRQIVLQKKDTRRDEMLTVRLIFKAQNGETSLLTDSRRNDGSHGVCPDLDPLLAEMGFREYKKWISPAARQARAEAQGGQPRSKNADVPVAPAPRRKNKAQE